MRILIVLFIVFLLFQLYPRSAKNDALSPGTADINSVNKVPPNVAGILKKSCYDCHSNKTIYPWYANIQPVYLWLQDHIKEGKNELNFSEFGTYTIRRKYRKLEEINDLVQNEEMPLYSYTIIHKGAKLNSDQKILVKNWVMALRDSFKANYPADSLRKLTRKSS